MQAPAIALDEEALRAEMREVARETVGQATDGILDARADELADAGRCGRTDERRAHGSGRHARGLPARAGRIEVGAGEAVTEMRSLGVSARSVEEAAGAPWEEGVSAGTVPSLSQDAHGKIDEWRSRPLTCERPCVFVDGTCAKSLQNPCVPVVNEMVMLHDMMNYERVEQERSPVLSASPQVSMQMVRL